MILDILPNQYETLAQKYTFRPWQTGLLADMLKSDNASRFLNVNMGSRAGHTYFTRIAASSEFPARTKIFITRQENLTEYSSLLFDEDKVHEPIELLDQGFSPFSSDIEFVLIDMSEEHPRRFKSSIRFVVKNAPASARLVFLHANFLNF